MLQTVRRGVWIWLGKALLASVIRQPFFWSFVSLAVLLLCTLEAIWKARRQDEPVHGQYPALDLNTVRGLTLFFILCGLILCLAFTGENPFVYFQF